MTGQSSAGPPTAKPAEESTAARSRKSRSRVIVAGAAGDLGGRVVAALAGRGATVAALLRHDAPAAQETRVAALGAEPVRAQADDRAALAAACAGASVVVCAWSGLRPVIIDRQQLLLDAAVRAGVPRFISSDFSADYTKTKSGHNRNLDLRREFADRADAAPIAVTSVLNGAFMDMVGKEMPIVHPRLRAVLFWGSADQPLDLTTRDDTAAYTAAAALDAETPRRLRIAGDSPTSRQIAAVMTDLTGHTHKALWLGPPVALAALSRLAQRAAPAPEQVFPAWQGMRYMQDMYSGEARLDPLDNNRYPQLRWTSLREHLATRYAGADPTDRMAP